VVGELRQVVPEYLTEAYTLLAEGTEAEGSTLEMRPAAIVAECEACGWTGPLPAGKFVCGQCGESRATIQGGTELYLDGLEVDDGD
jgi:hydrogenase nickel incorporation protein HypA/HybF